MREGLRANRPEDRHQGLKEYFRELVGEDCDIKPKCPTLLIMLYLSVLFDSFFKSLLLPSFVLNVFMWSASWPSRLLTTTAS